MPRGWNSPPAEQRDVPTLLYKHHAQIADLKARCKNVTTDEHDDIFFLRYALSYPNNAEGEFFGPAAQPAARSRGDTGQARRPFVLPSTGESSQRTSFCSARWRRLKPGPNPRPKSTRARGVEAMGASLLSYQRTQRHVLPQRPQRRRPVAVASSWCC